MIKKIALTTALVVFSLGVPTVHATMITLDQNTQGEGNMGASFRPWSEASHTETANFVMTARTGIDNNSPFDASAFGYAGTIYIKKNGQDDTPRGAGVQTAEAHGSKGISGGGGDSDEELIFTYDEDVYLDSINIWLGNIEFGMQDIASDKDDPVIFLRLGGSDTFDVTIPEADIYSAFSYIGDDKDKYGIVDFSSFTSLAGLSEDTAISAFKIRETNDHIYVRDTDDGAVIPEPAVLGFLAFGGLVMIRCRHNT